MSKKASFRTRDPGNVTLTFGALILDGGFADGSQIKVMSAGDGFKLKKGIRGDVTRSKTLDHTGSVTFRLQASSPYNAALTAIFNNDVASDNGAGVSPIQVADKGGASLDHANYAWIRKIPDQDYAEEDTAVEWIIDCADLERGIGGN